jgi:biotin transport system ATP-binding protein
LKDPLLEVRRLSHVFPDGTVGLDDVSLSLHSGNFAVLAGANGSGKTLLMRHLNGLLRPTSGEVLLDGRPILDDLPGARRRVGLVFQDADAQIVGQTVARDAAFGPENLRLPREEISSRVEKALCATGLVGFDQRRPHTLSGGEKRRLAVAGVIAMNPDILVLDEPFTGLDWQGSSDLITALTGLHRSGTTVLLITHDLDKVLAHADRLVFMAAGCIVADGPPDLTLPRAEAMGVRRPSGTIDRMSWLKRREAGV